MTTYSVINDTPEVIASGLTRLEAINEAMRAKAPFTDEAEAEIGWRRREPGKSWDIVPDAEADAFVNASCGEQK